MRDDTGDWIGIWLALALVVVGFGCFVWISFIAPCSSIGWVPVAQTPNRCLSTH